MSWIIAAAQALAGYRTQWQSLNAGENGSPMLELDFVMPLLAHFGDGRELLVCYVEGRHTLAMGIVVPRRRGVWEPFQPSQAPVRLWLQRAGVDMAPLLDSLTRTLPGTPLILGLSQRDPRFEPRAPGSADQKGIECPDTPRIAIEGSFDDYWRARGKNLRSNVKKQRDRLARDGIATRLQVSRDASEMADALRDFGRLDSAGGRNGIGRSPDAGNDEDRFYQAMLESFCRRGAASVYRYWFGEQLVAMDLCIEGYGMVVVLKTSYDENVGAGLSPVLLMREDCCRHFFDQAHFKCVEFYGKVMEWHTRWTDKVRTLYHVSHYRRPRLPPLHSQARIPPALPGQLPTRLAPRPAGQADAATATTTATAPAGRITLE